MDSRPLSRLLALAAMAAAISGCAATGGATPTEPRAVISKTSGDLRVSNSLDGQAILQAQGLAPGRSVSGTVQLTNSGTLTGDLDLQQLAVTDQPGANGGRLSDAVYLDVQDVTGGNAVPVFGGQLDTLQSRAIGSVGPGEARTYRFTASLPDSGAPPSPTGGDNAYAGSSLTVRYSWKATAPDPAGGGGGGSGGSGIAVTAPRVKLRVVSKKLLKRGWLDVIAACDRGCSITAWAELAKGKRVKARHKSTTLTMPGKAGRIRLKLSRRSTRALQSMLRKKPRVVLRVTVRVVAGGWGDTKVYTKKVTVKRPKPKRGRRR